MDAFALQEASVIACCCRLDLDGSGVISADNLSHFVGDKYASCMGVLSPDQTDRMGLLGPNQGTVSQQLFSHRAIAC